VAPISLWDGSTENKRVCVELLADLEVDGVPQGDRVEDQAVRDGLTRGPSLRGTGRS